MPGSIALLEATTAAPISATETVNIDDTPGGCSHSLSVLVDIRTLTGTWTVAAVKRLGSATITVATAQFAAGGGTGVFHVALVAAFLTANAAIPIPDQIVFTEDVAGTLDADVHVAAAG